MNNCVSRLKLGSCTRREREGDRILVVVIVDVAGRIRGLIKCGSLGSLVNI